VKHLLLTILVCAVSIAAAVEAQAQRNSLLLNEIVIAPPGTDSQTGCEYVELRAIPNIPLPDITYVDIEGDTEQNPGTINYLRRLAGVQTGSNGVIVIASSNVCRQFDVDAKVIIDPTFQSSFSIRNNGTNSFLLYTGLPQYQRGQDLDVDNNGVEDTNAPVFDGFGVRDTNNASDLVYGTVTLQRPAGTPANEAINAVTRFPGIDTRNSAAAFYFGDIQASPSSNLYNGKPSSRSANFPAGGALTPGDLNAPFFSLTILHSNDGESFLINAPGQQNFGGVARFATVVNNLRTQAQQQNSAVVLLNSGDNIIPGPSFRASLVLPEGTDFYDSVALRRIGFDSLGIGNHEFDLGPNVFARFVEGFDGQGRFVSGNLNYSGEPRLQALADAGILVTSRVIERQVSLPGNTTAIEKIGIVGVITDDLPRITTLGNVTVDPNLVGVLQSQVDALTAQGIDNIIATTHLQTINEDIALLQQIRDVDVVITGGGQETLARDASTLLVPGDVRNTNFAYPVIRNDANGRPVPIVTTNGNYKYVGRLKVEFDGAGNIRSIDPTSDIVRVAGGSNPDAVQPEASIQQDVVVPVQNFVNTLAQNTIGTSEVELNARRGGGNANPASVTPGVRTVETNLGSLFSDALLFQARRKGEAFGVPAADLPIVAIQNGGGIRGDALFGLTPANPTGRISELDTFTIANFSNDVAIVRNVPVLQLKEILENAYSRVENGDGRFAQISGFRVVYDQDLPARIVDTNGNVTQQGQRVREVQLLDGPNGAPGTFLVQNGAVLDPNATIDVATIDFLVNGGDFYPFNIPTNDIFLIESTYQQALFDYITVPTAQGGLGGSITAARYPVAGLGRVTRLN
jgi:2',3'-cyclic-nucleotide 2'-phosphodiesterase (5'-nucleotidase family)